jgi:hypothetical protein
MDTICAAWPDIRTGNPKNKVPANAEMGIMLNASPLRLTPLRTSTLLREKERPESKASTNPITY